MDDKSATATHDPPRYATHTLAWRDGTLLTAPIPFPTGAAKFPDPAPLWDAAYEAGAYRDYARQEHRNLDVWAADEDERLRAWEATRRRAMRGWDDVAKLMKRLRVTSSRRDYGPETLAGALLSTLGLLLLGVPADELLRRRGAKRKLREVGAPRSLFRDVAAVFSAADYATELGAGSPSYEVAGSRGRTRSTWQEVHVRASHVCGARARGLVAVELHTDAARALAGVEMEPIDWRAVAALARGERWRDVIAQYRVELGAGASIVTDDEIRDRVSDARRRLEKRLRRPAQHGDDMAFATGDATLAAGLIPPRQTERRRELERPATEALVEPVFPARRSPLAGEP